MINSRIRSSQIDGYEGLCFVGLTLCSPLKIVRRFGGTLRLNFYGRRQARNQHEVDGKHIFHCTIYMCNNTLFEKMKNCRASYTFSCITLGSAKTMEADL
jgi:hypothetical protein